MKGLLIYKEDWIKLWGVYPNHLKYGLNDQSNGSPYDALKVWWVSGDGWVSCDITTKENIDNNYINKCPKLKRSRNKLLHNFLEVLNK